METETTNPAASSRTGTTKLKRASRWEVYFPTSIEEDTDAVLVASFPKIIYFWPTMIVFLVCGFLSKLDSIDPANLAWLAIAMFSFNLLVIVQDFDQKKFIILVLVLVAIGLLSWVINLKGILLLDKISGFLGNLTPEFTTHAYFIVGSILLIFLLWGLVKPFFDYWRLEPNEFVHYIQPFGRDMSIPRMGHTVNREIPDVLEYLLTFGGGTLVVRSGDRVVARIPDIPMLGRRMRRIEKLLGVTRVTHVES